MHFDSYSFIFLFLPFSVICYFLLCKISSKLAKYFLIVCSLFFYAGLEYKMLFWLLSSIGLNYLVIYMLKRMSNKKLILWTGIAINVASLFYYKYWTLHYPQFNPSFMWIRM
jgi:D-alanyl-lipoteichoic acid acyltransferase DltB (MBOAT superfamily)